jgi:hypothetical protein
MGGHFSKATGDLIPFATIWPNIYCTMSAIQIELSTCCNTSSIGELFIGIICETDLEPERIRKIDRVSERKLVEINPAGEPDGILAEKGPGSDRSYCTSLLSCCTCLS